ncbi:Rho-GTPase-activating protein 8, partial [Choanephora cucurbitarum]
MTRSVYWSRCRAFKSVCPQFRPNINLTNQPLLQTLKSLSDQEMILSKEFVLRRLANESHINDSTSQDVWQNLLVLGFVKSVEDGYKLQHDIIDYYIKQPTKDWGQLLSVFRSAHPSEAVYKAYMEMLRSERAYKEKVLSTDNMRMQLEEKLLDCFDQMEQWEKKRMRILKEATKALHSMVTTFSSSTSIISQTYDQMSLFQEAISPEQDISCIVQQYKTSPFCPKPFIFENFFDDQASHQMFGVPIEQTTKLHKTYVPPIVSCAMQLIEQDIEALPSEEKHNRIKHIWCQTKEMKDINKACKELNDLSNSSYEELLTALKLYDVCTLANVIRVYLLELPECLLTYDFYETVKILYSGQQDDEESRIVSTAKLLSTLPSANYHTIKAFCRHMSRLLAYQTSDKLLQTICSLFSYVLLRPRQYSSTNVHDRHPKRLLRDLLIFYDKVFTQETDNSQEKNASRLTITAEVYLSQDASLPPPPPPKDTCGFHLAHSNDTKARSHSSLNGIPIVPHSSVTLFEDPEYSQVSTPTYQTFDIQYGNGLNPERLSTDISFVLDSEVSDDSSQTRTSEHDSFSTKEMLDNIDLEENRPYA